MKKNCSILLALLLINLSACDTPAYQAYDETTTSEITSDVQAAIEEPLPLNAETKALLEATVNDVSKRLTITYDDMENGTIYFPKIRPKLIDSNFIGINEYLDNNREPFINLEIYHKKNVRDGIALYNMQYYLVKADGRTFRIEAAEGMNRIKDDYGFEYEWYDGVIGDNEMEMLEAIATSKVAKIRCQGETHYLERTISEKEKQAISDMLALYDAHIQLYN